MEPDRSTSVIADAFRRHAKVQEDSFAQILPEANRAAEIFMEVIRRNGKMLVCGNGGSAADAQHFATEWVCKYKDDRRPLAAAALTVDTSALTAIGNDYGFDDVFSRQVEAVGNAGDVLVALTTSGKSKNILRAIEAAKRKGLKIIAMTGKKGADMAQIADVAIVVPSEETARIQEIHELLYHAWCEHIDAYLNS